MFSVQYMPGNASVCFFPVLPDVLVSYAPFRFIAFFQRRKPPALLFLRYVQEQFQNQVSAVPQLPFKFVDRPDSLSVFRFCDISAEILEGIELVYVSNMDEVLKAALA